jgi:hypothetical protein
MLAGIAILVIAGGAVLGAQLGNTRDKLPSITNGDDPKPRPFASRMLSTLFCLGIGSAFILVSYRKLADLYPMEGAVFLCLFSVGMVAGLLNRRLFGFWI